MSTPAMTLSGLRRMFEGVIPATMCTVSAEGVPHLCYLSQVEYVDDAHVALSFQFFNRSRENILATRRCMVSVDDPYTAAGIRMQLRYLRTESGGPLFERMKAKLAGIASHSGMSGVFRLLGSDIYEVMRIERLPKADLPMPARGHNHLAALRRAVEALRPCTDLEALLEATLSQLVHTFAIEHAIVMMFDPGSQRLYTVASHGCCSRGSPVGR